MAMEGNLSNYIRTHRKRVGLTQRELAQILGYTKVTVSRHERTHALPPLVAALGYSVLFSVPVGTLFGGMHDAVEQFIEQGLRDLEEDLRNQEARRQTLEWIAARRASLAASAMNH